MTDKQIKEEIKHINTRNQEYIAENNRMTKKIIDGLSCDNCPEFKRCQEQQTKKEYAINQVLQDIPSEYANIIDRLKQIIPSITRCDYVLEKQLKRKEQELKNICKAFDIEYAIDEETGNLIGRCNKLYKKEQECEKIKNWVKGMMFYTDCSNWFERFTTAFEDWKNDLTSQLDQLKAENEILKEKLFISSNSDKKTLKIIQTLTEIKEIARQEIVCDDCNFQGTDKCDSRLCTSFYLDDFCKRLLQKISECEV